MKNALIYTSLFATPFLTLWILYKMGKYQETVATLVAAVQENQNEVDSVIILLRQLHDLLQAGIDNQDFSQIQTAVKMLKDKDAELAAAVMANTPSDPNPNPVPVEPTPEDPAPVTTGVAATGTSSDPALPESDTARNDGGSKTQSVKESDRLGSATNPGKDTPGSDKKGK